MSEYDSLMKLFACVFALFSLFMKICDVSCAAVVEKTDFGFVLAALICVSGYIVDAQSSRRADLRAARLDRVSSQMSSFLVPVNNNLHSLNSILKNFIDGNMSEDGMLAHGQAGCVVRARQSLGSGFTSNWMFTSQAGLYRAHPSLKRAALQHFELPPQLEAAIEADPESTLAVEYRNWVREEWLPVVRRIGELIDVGAHSMEPLAAWKLQEVFGPTESFGYLGGWRQQPQGFFFSLWLSYARGWEALLKRWDNGELSRARPIAPFPCGLLWVMMESQSIAGDILKELAGSSQVLGSVDGLSAADVRRA